jgi:glycosyltransferase involved in cell wall biosynthesis
MKIPRNSEIKHAFLPPPNDDEDLIVKSYSNELLLFLKDHHPILIANAFQLSIYQNIDLYGLDLCVELIFYLKNKFNNVGLVFALSDENHNKPYFDNIKERLHQLNINNNFIFITGSKEIWPLFKKVDLLVRPTYTDGDAVSIREALYFGCPVIASNSCERPHNTILFENRDLHDFSEKCLEILTYKK